MKPELKKLLLLNLPYLLFVYLFAKCGQNIGMGGLGNKCDACFGRQHLAVGILRARALGEYAEDLALFERITVLHPHEGSAIERPALRGFDEKIP